MQNKSRKEKGGRLLKHGTRNEKLPNMFLQKRSKIKGQKEKEEEEGQPLPLQQGRRS